MKDSHLALLLIFLGSFAVGVAVATPGQQVILSMAGGGCAGLGFAMLVTTKRGW